MPQDRRAIGAFVSSVRWRVSTSVNLLPSASREGLSRAGRLNRDTRAVRRIGSIQAAVPGGEAKK